MVDAASSVLRLETKVVLKLCCLQGPLFRADHLTGSPILLQGFKDINGLKTHFQQYGAVNDCHVPKNRVTQQSKGFGFVEFAKSLYADRQGILYTLLHVTKSVASIACPRWS